jgi:predicted secreted protein
MKGIYVMSELIQKIISFLMSILAMFGVGKNNNEVPINTVDDVSSYSIAEKDLTIDFKANSSTGYAWVVSQEGDSIRKTSEAYKTDKVSNIMGAGGTQEYKYVAVREGTTTLTFRYLRSWEDDSLVYTYVAVISVSADLVITVDSFALV